jgi:acetate kinase
MSETVLVLNAGSSSLKFALYAGEGDEPTALCRGQVEGIGSAPRLTANGADGALLAGQSWEVAPAGQGHALALERLEAWAKAHLDVPAPTAVGHRVVHGGRAFDRPVLVDPTVMAALEALVPLAPLHQPHNLAAIREIAEHRPELPQVACFDTAFHRGHPSVVERFALPDALYRQGIRRYGFHGLSYEYVVDRLRTVAPEIAHGKVIVAHLGSGASLCALEGGRSVDTTMGLTALDGLPMATRCGSIDPGVLIYLLREHRMSVDELEELLMRESGLRGISGVSNDMRALLASEAPLAAEAVEHFVQRVARETGALASMLGGLDALVFTAGIGERSAPVRARICERCRWLGIELDTPANEAGAARISTPGSTPSAWVVPTNEERMIARHVLGVLGRRCGAGARPRLDVDGACRTMGLRGEHQGGTPEGPGA